MTCMLCVRAQSTQCQYAGWSPGGPARSIQLPRRSPLPRARQPGCPRGPEGAARRAGAWLLAHGHYPLLGTGGVSSAVSLEPG